MFFRAKNGDTYPVAAIARIETPYREGHGESEPFDDVLIHLNDGRAVTTRRLDVDGIRALPITSFAAAPGTFLISCEDDEIEKTPVIGWLVSQDDVRPIMVHGVFDNREEEWVILTPDGSVNDENAHSWPSVDAYRAYRRER
jgi:hypothetical protein